MSSVITEPVRSIRRTADAGSRRLRPADLLGVSVTTPGDTLTLCAVAGEVDSYTVAILRDALAEIAARPGSAALVVDLSKVTFFGVAGVRILIDTRHWAARSGRLLRVVTGVECVDRVISLVGEAAAVERRPDLASALHDLP